MIIFAIDRDYTVDVGDHPGPVPLGAISRLHGEQPVFAIGNQALVEEANIFSLKFLFDDLLKTPDLRPPTGRDADAIAANPEWAMDHKLQKLYRLTALSKFYHDDSKYQRIVVDDYELSCKGWRYFTPDQFCELLDTFGWLR